LPDNTVPGTPGQVQLCRTQQALASIRQDDAVALDQHIPSRLGCATGFFCFYCAAAASSSSVAHVTINDALERLDHLIAERSDVGIRDCSVQQSEQCVFHLRRNRVCSLVCHIIRQASSSVSRVADNFLRNPAVLLQSAPHGRSDVASPHVCGACVNLKKVNHFTVGSSQALRD